MLNNNLDQKTKLVDEVFSSIYKKYDIMNDVISLGSHRIIKRHAMKLCNYSNNCNLLDLAAGTGDLAIYYRKIDLDKNKIILADPNSEMLNYAKVRLADKSITENIDFVTTYAEDLPFEDNSFDNVSIGFGLRNFTDKEKSLDEIYRVLKKHGRLIIVDFSKPNNSMVNRLNTFYLNRIVPVLAKIITENISEYHYLAKSIEEHPSQQEIIKLLKSVGFNNCSFKNKINGIIAIHTAEKFD